MIHYVWYIYTHKHSRRLWQRQIVTDRETSRQTVQILHIYQSKHQHTQCPCQITKCCVCRSCWRLWLILTLILHFDWDLPLSLTQSRQTEHIWFHITRVIPSLFFPHTHTWSQTHTAVGFDMSGAWCHQHDTRRICSTVYCTLLYSRTPCLHVSCCC